MKVTKVKTVRKSTDTAKQLARFEETNKAMLATLQMMNVTLMATQQLILSFGQKLTRNL